MEVSIVNGEALLISDWLKCRPTVAIEKGDCGLKLHLKHIFNDRTLALVLGGVYHLDWRRTSHWHPFGDSHQESQELRFCVVCHSFNLSMPMIEKKKKRPKGHHQRKLFESHGYIRMDLFTFACFTNSVLYVEGLALWEFRKIAWNDSDWALVSNRTKKN